MIKMPEITGALKKFSLFSELNYEELQKLADIATKKQYPRRQYVFMEGERRKAVFFISSGSVKTFKVDRGGNEQVMNFLHSGDMFPHVGFFDDTPYPATAEVLQSAELLIIPIDDFQHLLLTHPRIAIKVMKIMNQKLLSLIERVQQLVSQDMKQRVVQTLIRLAAESGTETEDGIFIDMPITNRDFAGIVGASRETVNRILNQLKKEQLIDPRRNGILIYDLKKLEKALYSELPA